MLVKGKLIFSLIFLLSNFFISCKQDIRTCANCTIPENGLYIVSAKKGSITKVYYSVINHNNTYQYINVRDTINYLLSNGYMIDTTYNGGAHILPPIGRNIDLAFDSFKKMYPNGSCKKFVVDCDKCESSTCVCCQ